MADNAEDGKKLPIMIKKYMKRIGDVDEIKEQAMMKTDN